MSVNSGCIKTTCPYCGVGCGVSVQLDKHAVIGVKGLESHPANFGKLCVKGSALHETLDPGTRLLFPKINGERVSWDSALDKTAKGLQEIINKHGPQSVAFYLSGQLLTEDYYVANKLLKGFIGSSNLDTNSRLCMASAVVGYKRAFGADVVPCSYEDLESCEVLLLIGSNAAWTHPILYQRMQEAKKNRPGMKVVVIDPRVTASCDMADLHLKLKPGSDAFLFNGLQNFIATNGYIDKSFVENHCEGLEESLATSDTCDLNTVVKVCALSIDELLEFYRLFTEHSKVISFYSQGINQSATGSDKCNAIINCHLLTKKLGQPGMGPFSVTGQPNAMGGREVGGLANQLAAHMSYLPEDIDRVGRFWHSNNVASREGYKAVEMFDAIDRGEIKAIWIMATNPAVSLPDSNSIQRILDKCELVIVSDCVEHTDTNAFADILLPACGWGEKDGTVTNSERRISRQRAFMAPVGEARPDWQIISEVAVRMGFGKAFHYENPKDIFVEHARLSGFENNGSRLFDISAFENLSAQEYEDLEPIQWPVNQTNPGGSFRLFEDYRFYTLSKKAQIVPISASLPEHITSAGFPYLLNTGRLRDQWHTMTRTGLAARLALHSKTPFVAINPVLAESMTAKPGELLEIESRNGKILLPLKIDSGLGENEIFVPIHWSNQFSAKAKVSALIDKRVDKYSGQPESKFQAVSVKPKPIGNWVLLLTEQDFVPDFCSYWHKCILSNGYEYLLAIEKHKHFDLSEFLQKLSPDSDLVEFHDSEMADSRALCISRQGNLDAAIFMSDTLCCLPADHWRGLLLGKKVSEISWHLLSGRDINLPAVGNLICSCFEVGEVQIVDAINKGACSVEELGLRLKCGTNCGSCIPELKQLIQTFNMTHDQKVGSGSV